MLPTIIPILAPLLRLDVPDEPDEALDAIGSMGLVIATWVVLKTVSLRPMRVPTAGFWLQPASRATITERHVNSGKWISSWVVFSF